MVNGRDGVRFIDSKEHDMRGMRRRAFSMVEMTLVIALIGVLMAVAVWAFVPQLLRGKEAATKATMRTVDGAMGPYKAAMNAYPTALSQLAPNFLKTAPKDAWGRDFHYAVPGLNSRPYDMISAGDDGQFGTADDIDWAKVEQATEGS
jgi:general secretion pathway protein G